MSDFPIIEINLNNLKNKKLIENKLLTEITNALPEELKQYFNSSENRKNLLEKHGNKAFLMPDKLKFPVINPFTGEYHCGLIYAARMRAIQHHYPEVEKVASELYDKLKCKDRIHVKINENGDELYDLGLILTLVEDINQYNN